MSKVEKFYEEFLETENVVEIELTSDEYLNILKMKKGGSFNND